MNLNIFSLGRKIVIYKYITIPPVSANSIQIVHFGMYITTPVQLLPVYSQPGMGLRTMRETLYYTKIKKLQMEWTDPQG
jgi:hypothetical protein